MSTGVFALLFDRFVYAIVCLFFLSSLLVSNPVFLKLMFIVMDRKCRDTIDNTTKWRIGFRKHANHFVMACLQQIFVFVF